MKRVFLFILTLTLSFSFIACQAIVTEPVTSAEPVVERVAVPIAAEHYFKHIAKGERVSCENDPYSNTEDDGSFILPNSYVDGTPYSFNDILFDPVMLKGESVTTRKSGDGAPGSGITSYKWVFTPLTPGETEVMLVTDNLAEDTDECRVFHITIDNELRCALNWYEDGIMGTNYELSDLPASTPGA